MIGPGANQSGSTVGVDVVSSKAVVGAVASSPSLAHAPLGIMIVVAIIPAAASAETGVEELRYLLLLYPKIDGNPEFALSIFVDS